MLGRGKAPALAGLLRIALGTSRSCLVQVKVQDQVQVEDRVLVGGLSILRGRCGGAPLGSRLPPVAEELVHPRQHRDEDDGEDHEREVVLD